MIVIKKDIEVRHFQKEFLISQTHVPMKHNMIWGYPPYYISLVLGQVSIELTILHQAIFNSAVLAALSHLIKVRFVSFSFPLNLI